MVWFLNEICKSYIILFAIITLIWYALQRAYITWYYGTNITPFGINSAQLQTYGQHRAEGVCTRIYTRSARHQIQLRSFQCNAEKQKQLIGFCWHLLKIFSSRAFCLRTWNVSQETSRDAGSWREACNVLSPVSNFGCGNNVAVLCITTELAKCLAGCGGWGKGVTSTGS